MPCQLLTIRSIKATPGVLKLKRPVVARIATNSDWPVILIDLHSAEAVVGRSYREPYSTQAMKYLVRAFHDLGEMFKGRKLVPLELTTSRASHFILSVIRANRRLPFPASTWQRGMPSAKRPGCLCASFSADRLARSGPTTVTDCGCRNRA